MHELLAFWRHGTKAVSESLTVSCQIVVGLYVVKLAVEQHALTAARHIGLREVHLQITLHGTVLDEIAGLDVFAGFEFFGIEIAELFVFQLTDSLVENLLIGLVAQVFHEAALLGTQQIARTTDVQILHSEVETTAQVREGLQSLQAPACFGRHRTAWRGQQIAEGLAVATAHTATHLMQVRKTEMVGAVDDDRVGIGDVDTILHNRRREQHVVVVVDKVGDDLLQLFGRHLSMTDDHTTVGHILMYEVCNLLKIGDAVVDKEHLTVATHLEVDGIGNDFVTEGTQLGMDGIAVGWRRAHDAHIAGSHQTELQRTRNRCGRHRKGVDIAFQFPQLLLCGHAELLFLVDDEQSKVVPLHIFAQQLMRTDDDVYLAVSKSAKHVLGLLGSAGSGKILHPHGEVLQAFAECLKMLIGQHCGGHEYRHLLGVARCLESGAHRHLGLAETYVTTDEAVHRTGTLHVGFDVLSGLELVGSVLVEKACLQFVLHEVVSREGEALLVPTLGIQADEVSGNVLDALFGLLLQPLPGSGAERAQPWRLARVTATIFRDFIE